MLRYNKVTDNGCKAALFQIHKTIVAVFLHESVRILTVSSEGCEINCFGTTWFECKGLSAMVWTKG